MINITNDNEFNYQIRLDFKFVKLGSVCPAVRPSYCLLVCLSVSPFVIVCIPKAEILNLNS